MQEPEHCEPTAARTTAEEALRRYQLLANHTRDIVLFMDRYSGRLLEANEAAIKAYGYSRDELLALTIYDLRVDETRSVAPAQMAVASSQGILFETVHRRKDGSRFPVEVSSEGALIEGTDTLISVVRDITTRQQAEHALRESEERLRLFIEHAPAALAMFDREMRYVSVSRRWLSDYGLEGRDVIGQSNYEVTPEIPERWREFHRRGLAGEVVARDDDAFHRADGSVQWLRWEIRPWRDGAGRVAGIVIFTDDITERKRTEEVLARSQRTFADVIERAPFGIYVVDSRFCVAQMNASSQTGAFRNVRPVIGRDFGEAMRILWPEPVAADIIGHFRHTLDTGEPYYSPRFVNPRHDVAIVESYEWELHRILLPDGQPGVICYYFDSTALREAEQALRRSEGELSFALELNDALRGLDDPAQIQATAARMLAERLQADRAFYSEIVVEDGIEIVVIERDYHRPGLSSLTGRFVFSEFSHTDYEDYRSGRTVCSRNVFTDAREPKQREAYRAVDVAAFVGVPFVHRETLRGILGVLHGQPRDWTAGDVRLAEQTAARTWHAVERARAEAAQAESERRYRGIVETAEEGIATHDVDGTITYVNQRMADMLGYPSEEIVGRSGLDFVEDDERQAVISARDSLKERGSYTRKLRRKDGSILWTLNNMTPQRDSAGRVSGYLAMHTDITARKQVEEERQRLATAVQQEHDRLSALINSITDEIWFADADKTLTLVNPAVWREFGTELGDTADVRTIAARFEVCRPDGTPRPVEEAPPLRALQGEIVIGQEEIVRTPVTGQLRHRQVNAAPVRDNDGRIIGSVSVVRDITAHKQAEDALREANAALAEADRRKDEFIAILSHELRNPLAPIRYALPLVQAQTLDESATRAVTVLARQVDHLTRLVDDLLDVSRITQGKIELHREWVTLSSVIETACEAASPGIIAARHKLSLVVSDNPIWLYADPARLAQVLTNLLNNSAKYTPRGGDILLKVERDDGRAMIRVRDSGVGIPPHELGTVFDMFRQVPLGDKSLGGLGIGLALAKRLVEMHDGTIEALSEGPGRGAEFVVTLPLAEGMGVATSDAAATVTTNDRRLRVLIVDDNADLVEMLAIIVETAGHDVCKAHDGRSAVSAALSYRPHVVFLDLGLPVISGIEVAKELRRNPEMVGVRLVALTGWGQAEDRRQTQEAGFEYHLTKPTDPREIERLLAQFASAVGPSHPPS